LSLLNEGDVMGPYSPVNYREYPAAAMAIDTISRSIPTNDAARVRNHRTALDRLDLLADYLDTHHGTVGLNVTEVAARIRDNLKLLRS
jgi:hypothetical protein